MIEDLAEMIVLYQAYADEARKRIKFYDWVKENYPKIIQEYDANIAQDKEKGKES